MNFSPRLSMLALVLLCMTAPNRAEAKDPERIVFLGDSITDGHTYPLLIQQALTEANKPVPVCINAGVASDTAKLMRARLDRDVLAHRPNIVTISAGTNDVLRGVTAEEYAADLAVIVETLKAKEIKVVLLTPTVLGPKLESSDKRLADYVAAQRRIAEKQSVGVAEVNALMHAARDKGEKVLEDDQVHISFPGYRLMARAVLDALGHKVVAVPTEMKVAVMPGLVRNWSFRPTPAEAKPLDEKSVATLAPDASWKSLTLPEPEKQDHWWKEAERQRGFVMNLGKSIGPSKSWQGVATLTEREPRKAYFNTGAQLQSIWVNGKQVYRNTAWTGWHAGKERIPVELQAGDNRVVVETGAEFFLSVTDTNDW